MEQLTKKKKWVSSDPREIPAILAAVKGDQDSFAFLYHLHYPKTYSFCLAELKSPEAAEDIAQDVFLQVSRKLGMFRFEAALSTWIRRIAINYVLRYKQLSKNNPKLTISIDTDDQEDGQNPEMGELDSSLEIVPMKLLLSQAKATSTKSDLSNINLLTLQVLGGYEEKELASMKGLTVTATKTRLFRARRRLKTVLRQHGVTSGKTR